MITKSQIKRLHTLLNAYAKHRGFPIEKEEKQAFVAECSGGRCTSTTELNHKEAEQMISDLANLTYSSTDYQKADRQRKLMIHYARQMAWETEDGKADMARINAWCIKTGYLHKPLMKHDRKELPKLVNQFQRMYIAFLKSI